MEDRALRNAEPHTFEYRKVGRDPAPMPDPDEALRALGGFLWRYTDALRECFRGISRERNEKKCAYTSSTLLWSAVVGLFLHLSSRNQMDMRRNEERFARAIFALSGQPVPEGVVPHTPCSGTVTGLLRAMPAGILESALEALVRRMLRSKLFKKGLLFGRIAIAVDGTEQERARGKDLTAIEKIRNVLEAKIVTPWGWNIPVMSEPVAPWTTEEEKQDCEWWAFHRLAARLKRAFPRLPICILGDALYACAPVVELCRHYEWSYLLTFKKGRTPNQHMAVEKTLARAPDEHSDAICGEDRTGTVGWVRASEIEYETGERALGNVVLVQETVREENDDGEEGEETKYRGAFVTDLPVEGALRATEMTDWARRRWKIENGFHTLKGKDGFGLEHTFCNDENARRNMHTLMNIAHALWQVFHSGWLRQLGANKRKVTQAGWAKMLFDAIVATGLAQFLCDEVAVLRMSRAWLE